MNVDDEDSYLDDIIDIQLIFEASKKKRLIKYRHTQMNWTEHVEMLNYISDFEGTYRMSEHSFNILLEGIREDITLSFIYSSQTMANEAIMILKRIANLLQPYAITDGKAIGVSDASVNSNDEGSQSFIIESTDEPYHISGSGPVDCDEDDVGSTISEMTWVLAILLLLQIICEEYSIISGNFNIYCDNKEAINIKQDHPYLLSYIWFCSNNYTRIKWGANT